MAPRDEKELMSLMPNSDDDFTVDEQEAESFEPPMPEGDGVWIHDNIASTQIEDFDQFDHVEVDENPHMPSTVDNDGLPGLHPYSDAAQSFEQQAGLLPMPEKEEFHDEFEETLRQHEESAIGADGKQVSDLQRLVLVDNKKQEVLSSIAPYARVNPPTAARALLGGKATVTASQPPVQVVHWEGEDVEALPVTVTVSPFFALMDGSPIPFGFARIQWGTRDSLHTVDIDVGTGFQVTIDASVVYVSVGIDPIYAQFNPTQQFGISASVGYYTCSRTSPLTFTNIFDSSIGLGTGTPTFNRPSYASGVKLLLGVPIPPPPDISVLPPVLLTMICSVGGPSYSMGFNAGPPPGITSLNFFSNLPVIPLSSDVIAVNITQDITTYPLRGRLIWELAL